MIDVRTLLFANAVVFAVLAIAMILVWRGNPGFPGLASLARVHLAMMPGAALVGLPPGVVPAFVSVILGNGLVVLGVAWLFEGIRELYHRPRDSWTWIALGAQTGPAIRVEVADRFELAAPVPQTSRPAPVAQPRSAADRDAPREGVRSPL